MTRIELWDKNADTPIYLNVEIQSDQLPRVVIHVNKAYTQREGRSLIEYHEATLYDPLRDLLKRLLIELGIRL